MIAAAAGLCGTPVPQVFINGGEFTAPESFGDDSADFGAMAPGEVAAYWRDGFADRFLGPARANRTVLDWQRHLAAQAESRELLAEKAAVRLESSGRVRSLDWSMESHGLDESILVSGLTVRIRVAYLVAYAAVTELQGDARSLSPSSLSEYHGEWPEFATLAWLETIWLDKGLVSTASIAAWRQERKGRGLDDAMSVAALVQHVDFKELEIGVEISTLLESCRRLGLKLGFSTHDLQQLVAALSLGTGTEVKDLLSRFRNVGLISSETERHLVSGTDWAALRDSDRALGLKSLDSTTSLAVAGHAGGPDICLGKSYALKTTRRMAVVTYTIHVTNTGTMPAVDIVISDIVPKGMKYVDAFAKGDEIRRRTYRHPETRAVIWRLDRLDPGRSVDVGFRARFAL